MYTVQCLVNANKYTHTHRGFDSLGKHSTVKLEDCTITKVLVLYRWLHPSPKSSFWNKLFAQKTPFHHQCLAIFSKKSKTFLVHFIIDFRALRSLGKLSSSHLSGYNLVLTRQVPLENKKKTIITHCFKFTPNCEILFLIFFLIYG